MKFGVSGLGLGVWGFGIRVGVFWGLGFRDKFLRVGVWGVGIRVWGFGVWGFGIRVWGVGVSGCGIKVWRFGVSGLRFGGCGFRD